MHAMNGMLHIPTEFASIDFRIYMYIESAIVLRLYHLHVETITTHPHPHCRHDTCVCVLVVEAMYMEGEGVSCRDFNNRDAKWTHAMKLLHGFWTMNTTEMKFSLHVPCR